MARVLAWPLSDFAEELVEGTESTWTTMHIDCSDVSCRHLCAYVT
jgi:hypothetical protein